MQAPAANEDKLMVLAPLRLMKELALSQKKLADTFVTGVPPVLQVLAPT
jgi:hypothetical protein